VSQRIAQGQEHPDLDVGVPALEGVNDSLPGIRLFRIGGEEEGQRIVVGTTPGSPRRQRRRAKRAGADQKRPPIELLSKAGVRRSSPSSLWQRENRALQAIGTADDVDGGYPAVFKADLQ
jgi:hypothetical protein